MDNKLSQIIPIYHIASMARSGETLILHILRNHPDVIITHNINQQDMPYEKDLFNYIRRREDKHIDYTHHLLRPYNPTPSSIVVIKQGVWNHPWPFNGFILARNPLSIFASLRVYDRTTANRDLDENWRKFRIQSMISWLKLIAPDLIPGFGERTIVDQFCSFYNRRMNDLFCSSENPIVHYETLVSAPSTTVSKITKHLGLQGKGHQLVEFKNRTNTAIGHGHFDRNRQISTGSLDKYKRILTLEEIEYIIYYTQDVAALFGYRYTNNTPVLASIARQL